MNAPRILVALTLLLGVVPATAAPPAPQLRRYALLVGANDGGEARVRLRYAGSDAQAMSRVLGDLGGVASHDQQVLLDADRSHVLTALGDLRKQLEAAPKGVRTEVFFYYSGHSDERGLLLKEERLEYLELRRAIDALPADVRISILDSCASGAFTRAKGGAKAPAFLVDVASSVSGHAILTSSSEDEVSQESDRIRGSYFTHHLVSGLRGAADHSRDGRVTLNEAYQFAFDQTLSRTERTRAGPQHASYDIQLAGTGELIMTDVRATSAGLALSSSLDGHLFVRDARGTLVVEVEKEAGRTSELGLAPGSYRITRAVGSQRSVADVVLAKGQRTALSEAAFSAIATEAVVTRGSAPSEVDDVRKRFLNLSLIHGVSTNDGFKSPADNGLSIGLASTLSARLSGLALAFGLNQIDGAQHGIAAALGANTAGGAVKGAQLSLGGNWSARELVGAQLTLGVNRAAADARWNQSAVLANLAMRDFTGAQLAVGGNDVAGALTGVQAAVGFSWARERAVGLQGAVGLAGTAGDLWGVQLAAGVSSVGGHARGVQIAGLATYAQRLVGVQLALVNIGGDIEGTQIGVVNVAGRVGGAQVGVVNLADDSDFSFGLVNVVKHGRFNVEAYGSDLAPLSVALKMGNARVYSILMASTQAPQQEGAWWSVGLGVGTHVPLHPRFSLDVDLTGQSIRTYAGPAEVDSIVPQLRAQLAWHLAERFALFAGPSLNLRVPIAVDAREEPLGWIAPPVSLGPVDLWPGFVAGIRI